MEITFRLDEIESAAEAVLAANPEPVILFNGEMGAGKTTFIKALCRALGVIDAVSSPTFSLINEYRTSQGDPVFHFDAYRLKDESEAYGIGMDEYLDSGAWCLVEWASKIPNLIPGRHSVIDIVQQPGGTRKLVLS